MPATRTRATTTAPRPRPVPVPAWAHRPPPPGTFVTDGRMPPGYERFGRPSARP